MILSTELLEACTELCGTALLVQTWLCAMSCPCCIPLSLLGEDTSAAVAGFLLRVPRLVG